MEMNNKKILLTLSISILINVLVIGIFIGQNLKKIPFRHEMNMHRPRPEMLFNNNEFKKFDSAIKEAENRIEKSLLKEPYDKKAVMDALTNLDMQMAMLRTEAHKKILEEAAILPPNERLRLLPRRKFMQHQQQPLPPPPPQY